MSDAGYVVAAWLITGGVLGGYTLRLQRRLRRAEGAPGRDDAESRG